MIVISPDQYRHMPWKNGGGSTTEIAVSPVAASLDAFDWRVSMAGVVEPGPFSAFAGVDRTLSVLTGNGIVLDIEGRAITLVRDSRPLSFPADVRVHGAPIDGPISDLNVMTRRGRCQHSVLRLTGFDEIDVWGCGATNLILSINPVEIRENDAIIDLPAGATARFDDPAGPIIITSDGAIELYLIEIFLA
jgi:environmental stress-induced protein Ves